MADPAARPDHPVGLADQAQQPDPRHPHVSPHRAPLVRRPGEPRGSHPANDAIHLIGGELCGRNPHPELSHPPGMRPDPGPGLRARRVRLRLGHRGPTAPDRDRGLQSTALALVLGLEAPSWETSASSAGRRATRSPMGSWAPSSSRDRKPPAGRGAGGRAGRLRGGPYTADHFLPGRPTHQDLGGRGAPGARAGPFGLVRWADIWQGS
jgi:hypothetical protein